MKYCLRPEIKEQLVTGLTGASIVSAIIVVTTGFIWFFAWGILGYPPYDPTCIDYTLATIGYFVWAFIIYYIVTNTYYWLKHNIIECKDTQ